MGLPVDLPQEFTQALFVFDQFYSTSSHKTYSKLSFGYLDGKWKYWFV